MKIIFCGWMYSDIEKEISSSKNPHPVSGHKYQENLCWGLLENKCDLTVINSPRVRHYPDYPVILLKRHPFKIKEKKAGVEIGLINLFGLNYFFQFLNTFKELKRIADNTSERIVLVTFNSYVSQSLAMLLLRSLRKNVELCDAIGDLHGKYGFRNHKKGMKKGLLDVYEQVQDWLAAKFDSYIFLSDFMKEALNIEKKKYTVVEGFAPEYDDTYVIEKKPEEKMIFYAGALQEEYGISHLLRAFGMIKNQEYRLIFAGTGDSADIIKKCMKKDGRVVYLGLISPNEVKEYQRHATCLISPRLPEQSFVKYSFPSKTMECLASGVPYVAHRLPCEPPEYARFIQYPKGTGDEDLMREMVRICEMKEEEWLDTGRRARCFVNEMKTPKKQCEKVLKLFSNA